MAAWLGRRGTTALRGRRTSRKAAVRRVESRGGTAGRIPAKIFIWAIRCEKLAPMWRRPGGTAVAGDMSNAVAPEADRFVVRSSPFRRVARSWSNKWVTSRCINGNWSGGGARDGASIREPAVGEFLSYDRLNNGDRGGCRYRMFERSGLKRRWTCCFKFPSNDTRYTLLKGRCDGRIGAGGRSRRVWQPRKRRAHPTAFCCFETAAFLNYTVDGRDVSVHQQIEGVVRDPLQNVSNLFSLRHRLVHFSAKSENFLDV